MLESISNITSRLQQTLADPKDDRSLYLLARRIKVDTWKAVSEGDTNRPSAWLRVLRIEHRKLHRSHPDRPEVQILGTLIDDLWLAESVMPRNLPDRG